MKKYFGLAANGDKTAVVVDQIVKRINEGGFLFLDIDSLLISVDEADTVELELTEEEGEGVVDDDEDEDD